MNVHFTNRNTGIDYKPAVTTMVNEYSHHAVGGPEEASISIRGNAESLVDMTRRLGYRVEIHNEDAVPVWWGYLFSAEVRFGERRVNASLGRMANKIRVAYSKLDPGQETSDSREITAWATDSFSVERYGTKEMVITKSDLTTEAAELARDLALEKQRLPKREVTSGISEGGSLSGLLRCKGWFNTLGWETYEQEAGKEAHEVTGAGTQAMGEGTVSKIAQSFQISSADPWYAEKLSVRARKNGNPTDNCVLTLHSDSGGVPGTQLASATIAGTFFSDEALLWMGALVSARYELQPSTTYWFQIARSGAPDGSNYYIIDVDEGLQYSSGVMKMYTSSWITRTPDADLLFRVGGTRETTQQIDDMMSSEGQFLTGFTIRQASGIYTNPYRDGKNDVLYYLRELLALGRSTGVRYIAKVDRQQHLWVYEEPLPDPSRPDYTVDEFDVWHERGGGPIPKNMCPVAGWYRIAAMPEAYASAEVLDTGLYFMERSTYRPKNDILLVDPPDSEDVEEEIEFV